MTGGHSKFHSINPYYLREKSPYKTAPTIEELNDRKYFYKYIYNYKSYFIYIIINAMFL